MTVRRVLVHGLIVATEVDLQCARSAPDGCDVDLRIVRRMRRVVDDEPPPGSIIAAVPNEQRCFPFSTTTRDTEGVVRHRVHRVCELEYAADGSTLSIDVDPRCTPGLVDVVVAGTGLTIAAVMRGLLVLHASAVELPRGGAVGFLGGSGRGKSTLAALCCAAGASLIADDVLRVDVGATPVLAHGGPATVRLRPSASSLLDRVGRRTADSPDGRIVVELPRSDQAVVPLRAVFVVARTDDHPVGVSWQHGRNALLLLESCPRLVGWIDPVTAPRQFELRSALAAAVDVGVVTVPTTLPFDSRVPHALFDVLGAVSGISEGRGIPLPAW